MKRLLTREITLAYWQLFVAFFVANVVVDTLKWLAWWPGY